MGKYVHSRETKEFSKFPENTTDLDNEHFDITPTEITMENNGQTLVMNFTFQGNNDFERPTMHGGPLGSEVYRFGFIYFHWLDEEDIKGINSLEPLFPMELHSLYINSQYKSLEIAITENFGIAIVSTLVTVSKIFIHVCRI